MKVAVLLLWRLAHLFSWRVSNLRVLARRRVWVTKTHTTEENIVPSYLCLQRSLPSENRTKPSPAQMQEMYAKFGAWTEKFKDNLTDMGGKLGPGTLVTSAAPADGPPVARRALAAVSMPLSAEPPTPAI